MTLRALFPLGERKMNPKRTLARGLALLAGLPFLVSSAYGQTTCTPVVYALRHAG
jgi:hypothetical protein